MKAKREVGAQICRSHLYAQPFQEGLIHGGYTSFTQVALIKSGLSGTLTPAVRYAADVHFRNLQGMI